MYAAASEFDDLHQELSQIRQSYQKSRSSYWVGGGFGIRGAIKGKVKAGILNAGSSAINTAGNIVRGTILAGIDHSKEEDLKNKVRYSSRLHNAVMVGVDTFSKNIACLLTEVLCGKDTLKQYMMIYDTVSAEDHDIESMTLEQAQTILPKNPFDITAYITIYLHNQNNGSVLSEMADFCGVQEHIFSGFLAYDGTFGEHKFDVNTIGVDTSREELLRIKETLTNLEKNNPAYICADFWVLYIMEMNLSRICLS